MAVTSIKQGYSGVENGGDNRTRWYTRVFTVTTDSATQNLSTLDCPLSSGDVTIPLVGTPYASDPYALSEVPNFKQEGPMFWRVSVRWATPDPSGGGSGSHTTYADPLDQPAQIAWTSFEDEIPYHQDLDGYPLVNKAGQPYSDPLIRKVKNPLLTIERNEAAFDPADKLLYEDTVCAESYLGADAGRARMLALDGRSIAATTPYWRKTYQIAFRMKTPTGLPAAWAWFKVILNWGYGYRKVAGDPASYIDTTPERTLLALDGTRITDPNAATYLGLREYFSQSWTALGLPT
jgi:hypothetical protein